MPGHFRDKLRNCLLADLHSSRELTDGSILFDQVLNQVAIAVSHARKSTLCAARADQLVYAGPEEESKVGKVEGRFNNHRCIL
jgi:hypothetical protein